MSYYSGLFAPVVTDEIFNAVFAGTLFSDIFDIGAASQVCYKLTTVGGPTVTVFFQTANTIALPVAADFDTTPLVPPAFVGATLTWYISYASSRWGRFGMTLAAGAGSGVGTITLK